MKKILLTFVAVAFLSIASFAQGRFSIGAELAFPMGDFGDVVGTGIGATVRYEAPINDNLSWTATAGFISFMKKEIITDYDGSATAIPIQGGVKYYFTESFNGFYAAGELGIHLFKVKVSTPFGDSEGDETEVSFAPGVGYHLGSLDISGRYQIAGDGDYFGIRVAYVLGAK